MRTTDRYSTDQQGTDIHVSDDLPVKMVGVFHAPSDASDVNLQQRILSTASRMGSRLIGKSGSSQNGSKSIVASSSDRDQNCGE